MLGVSDKTVSKWETGRGYPDIGILEELAKAFIKGCGDVYVYCNKHGLFSKKTVNKKQL